MSKTCTLCNAVITDSHLNWCRSCTEKQSHKAVLALQRNYLGFVVKGEIPLIFSKPFGTEGWHVAMTGLNEWGWCGQKLEAQWKKRRLKWVDRPADLCQGCREALKQAMEEQREVA